MSQTKYASYSDLTDPALKDAINHNCLSTIHLATLVAEFAQEVASAYETFAEEVQKIVSTFRGRNRDLKAERLDSPSTIYNAWENLLKETELDAQAHFDAAALLVKNVSEPLHEVAKYKRSQAQKLQMFRENFEMILNQSETKYQETEQTYMDSYGTFKNCGSLDNREGLRHEFHNAHNEYLLQIRASNRIIDEFQLAIPQILEEMDEIYIDTSNTVNVAIESHSLLLLTKANEQQRRLENLLKCCRQVSPQMDITYFVRAVTGGEEPKPAVMLQRHRFCPADHLINSAEESIMNHLIIDRVTEVVLGERRAALQKEALEVTSYIKQNQDITHSLVNMCQRNLANHLYSKVYETQEDMCRKRNEIRVANLQLGAVRSQIELLTPKQNGSVDDEQEKKNPSTIRGMWKKAFKTLKSSSSVEKLYTIPEGKECPVTIIIEDVECMPDDVESTPTSHIDSRKQWRRVLYLVQAVVSLKKSKKSSFSRKKQNSKDADDEVEQLNSGPVDPVYSLLKCAADLPRSGGKSPCLVHPHCSGQHSAAGYSRYPSGGDSSGNTSKTSSPSSSALVIRRDFALALPHQNVTGVSNRSSYNSLDHAHYSPDHTYRPDDHSPSANQPAAVLMDSYNPYNSSKHPSLEGCVPIVIEPPVSREASHSPKTRRKKLNARMKSFSLDTPEPPKQLLGIDETTKKKSSSFTNTCFGGKESPDEKMMSFSAASLRKKFALGRASSLETDDKKNRSYTPSPKESPKSQRKEKAGQYVALYNFKAKEKDDMDLRPGWRVTVTDSSKKDWWKGKSHGKSGYFPSTYIIPLLPDQRVFQVLQPLNLSDGHYAIKFHKDQIVLQVGDEADGMIQVRAANNRQAMCPLVYLQEL